MIDSLNGLKNQSAWHAKQLHELQSMRLQMENQQKRSWIFGSLMAIFLSIAIIAPWYVSILFDCILKFACGLESVQITQTIYRRDLPLNSLLI